MTFHLEMDSMTVIPHEEIMDLHQGIMVRFTNCNF